MNLVELVGGRSRWDRVELVREWYAGAELEDAQVGG